VVISSPTLHAHNILKAIPRSDACTDSETDTHWLGHILHG